MPGRGGTCLADPDYHCRRLDTASLAPCPARSDRLRSRFAPLHPWTRAAQGLSDQSFSLPAGDDGKRASRPWQRAPPGFRPKRPRTLDSVVGAARARDAARENCRTRADPRAQGKAAHLARAALRRPGRRLHAPDLRNRLGGNLREAEGPFLRRAAPLGANALRAPARDIAPGGRAPGARRAEGWDPVLLSSRSGLRAPRSDFRPVLRGLRRDDHRAFAHDAAHRRPRSALRDAHAAGRCGIRAAVLSGLGKFPGRRRCGRRAPHERLHRGARARNARAILLDAQALQDATAGRGEMVLRGRYEATGHEAEFEPGSRCRVLRNLLGITRVRDMNEAESQALELAQEAALDREGNGPLARLLALLMALQAGLPPLDFSPLSGHGRRLYIAGIHAAMDRNYAPLTGLFARVIERSRRRDASSGR